jgi:hypothetical protein
VRRCSVAHNAEVDGRSTRQEDLQCDIEKREIEEHHLEELKSTACEEALHDLGHETDTEDQVSNFLHCCLILLNDPDATRKLTQMLATCMGKEMTDRTISSPLPEREVCPGQQAKSCIGREFKMTTELGGYDMDGVMLDLGST